MLRDLVLVFVLKWNACSFNMSDWIFYETSSYLEITLAMRKKSLSLKNFNPKVVCLNAYTKHASIQKGKEAKEQKLKELQILHAICYKLKRAA